MRNIKFLVLLLLVSFCSNLMAQKSSNNENYFGEQMVIDSSSIIGIPILYNPSLFSSSKMEFLGNYYANIMFYNFKTDSYNKLFPSNTYIKSFSGNSFYGSRSIGQNISKQYVLLQVANVDHNQNNKIDTSDPSIFYICNKQGENVVALTTEEESVESFILYEKENFVMLKIQRDSNNDGDFNFKDKDFYYVKLDLNTLKFGNKIELK